MSKRVHSVFNKQGERKGGWKQRQSRRDSLKTKTEKKRRPRRGRREEVQNGWKDVGQKRTEKQRERKEGASG